MTDRRSLLLVVEDDPDQVALIRASFARHLRGTEVRVVGTGEAALDYLLGRPPYDDAVLHPGPVAVLLDLGLPGMSGLEVLEVLREEAPECPARVVVFTSSGDPRNRERARELGAAGFLTKPADFAVLADAVRPYLPGPGSTEERADSA